MYEQEYWFSNIVIQWTVFRCEDTFEWTSFECRFSNIRQWSDKLYSILLSSTSSLLSYGDIRISWTSFKYYSLKISSMLWFKKYSIMSSLSYERFRMLSILIFYCESTFIWTSFDFRILPFVECCNMRNIRLWVCFHMNKLWILSMLWLDKYSIMSLLSYEYCNIIYEQ